MGARSYAAKKVCRRPQPSELTPSRPIPRARSRLCAPLCARRPGYERRQARQRPRLDHPRHRRRRCRRCRRCRPRRRPSAPARAVSNTSPSGSARGTDMGGAAVRDRRLWAAPGRPPPGRAQPGGHPRSCRRRRGPWTCVCVAFVSPPQPLLSVTCVTDVFWAVVCVCGQTLEISPPKHHSSTYFQHVRTSNRPLQ